MKTWLIEHRYALIETFGHLRRQPWSAFLNVLVVGIALALPLAGFTLLTSLQPVTGRLASEPEISVFMALDAQRAEAEMLGPRLRALPGVAKAEFVTREAALAKLKAQTGMSEVIAALENNPFPDAWVLRLTPIMGDGSTGASTGAAEDMGRGTAAGVMAGFASGIKSGLSSGKASGTNSGAAAAQEKLAVQIRALPKVDHVQIDSSWVRRMEALVQFLRLGLRILAGALAIAVVAVIFNTIRLQVLTQREEIEVTRLIGATNRFIRRPFYYMGALQGLSGGLLALGLVTLALLPLNAAVADFARLYASDFLFHLLPWPDLLIFLGMTAALGWLGAMLSVSRHLAKMAPCQE